MNDSKVAQLAREIYQKHTKALDIIFEHRPDIQASIFEYLKKQIEARDEFKIDKCSKGYLRFGITALEPQKWLYTGDGVWTPSKRIVLFEFKNTENSLNLYLIIGPGDSDIRRRLFTRCQGEKGLFKIGNRSLTDQWTTVWKKQVLNSIDLEQPEQSIFTTISMKFSEFLTGEFPKIKMALDKPIDL